MRAVLFDLDGTLLDRRATFRRHLERQIVRHAGMFDPLEATRYVDRLLELDENGTLDRGRFYEEVEAELGLAPGSGAVLIEDFERHFPETCVPMPNVSECLSWLRRRGFKLGLITNGRELIQRRKIDGLGLGASFDTVLISGALGYRKPDPRIFREGLSRLDVLPGEAAYVGDDPEPDIRGAKEAGLVAIWRRDPFWPPPEQADLVIDDLAEIPGWIRSRGRGARGVRDAPDPPTRP